MTSDNGSCDLGHRAQNLWYDWELQDHAQGTRHDPGVFNPGDKRVKPIQQHLSDYMLSKVFDAAIQPSLEQVRVIGGIQDLGEPAVTELLLDWLPHCYKQMSEC